MSNDAPTPNEKQGVLFHIPAPPPKVSLSELDLPDEWDQFQADHGGGGSGCPCPTCMRTTLSAAFATWLRPRLADQDQVLDIEWCERCDRPGLDLHVTGDQEKICEPCFEDYFFCEDCEKYYRPSVRNTVNNGFRAVCDRCISYNWVFCEHCDDYFPIDYGCEINHNDCDCESPARVFSVPNDGDGPLRNDERASVSLPAGVISDEGLAQIRRLISNQAYGSSTPDAWFQLAGHLPSLGVDWQTKAGNYTKRLSRLAYKECGLKVEPALISEVGNIARNNSTAVDFAVEFTRDLNLSPDEFYHDGSCWWSDYYESRCALKTNGGIGMRSFDNYAVTGRAWVLPLKSVGEHLSPTFETLDPAAYVVFNGYGDLSGYTPARILSHMAGMTYRKVRFYASPMYVNNDSAYLVAPEEIASRFTDGELSLDLDQHSSLYTTERQVSHASAAA